MPPFLPSGAPAAAVSAASLVLSSDYKPAPITHLNLTGCGLTCLPAVLGAAGHDAETAYQIFEAQRRFEILHESSSDEESDDDGVDDAALIGLGDDDDDGEGIGVDDDDDLASALSVDTATEDGSRSEASLQSGSSRPNASSSQQEQQQRKQQSARSDASASKSVSSSQSLATLKTADAASFASSASSASSGSTSSSSTSSSSSSIGSSSLQASISSSVKKGGPASPQPKSGAYGGRGRGGRRGANDKDVAAATAHKLKRLEKKKERANRRSRKAPPVGPECLVTLNLSSNRLSSFPGPAQYADGTDTGVGDEAMRTPKVAPRFVPLGLVAAHLYGLTSLDLSRNHLQEIDPRVFGSPRSPPHLTTIDFRCGGRGGSCRVD